MDPDDVTEPARPVDLTGVGGTGGVMWSVSLDGLHANLVVLGPGEAIAPHRNDAVDVLVVVLSGAGKATIDAHVVELTPTAAPCSHGAPCVPSPPTSVGCAT